MNTNASNNTTPLGVLDALELFEPDFLISRGQPAEAETRAPIDARVIAENVPSEDGNQQA